MATTATRPKKTTPDPAPFERLQQAMTDIEHAAERAGDDVRSNVDDALARIRDAAGDLRKRAESQAADLEKTFESATEDARRELGRRAVRVQRNPEALSEISAEVRRRRAQLARQAKATGHSRGR
jgi:hypothetical protein